MLVLSLSVAVINLQLFNGAMEWYKRKESNIGLGRLDILTDAVEAHRSENDTVQQFIEDDCTVGENHFIAGAQFTSAYKNWCDENSIKPLGGRRLSEVMRRKGFESKQKWANNKNLKSWLGIGLRIEQDRVLT